MEFDIVGAGRNRPRRDGDGAIAFAVSQNHAKFDGGDARRLSLPRYRPARSATSIEGKPSELGRGGRAEEVEAHLVELARLRPVQRERDLQRVCR